MRKIFGITCHKLTNPLIHTVNYLSSFKENVVLIHLDLKSSMEDFKFLISDNVLFIPDRVDLVWGAHSQIVADLNLLSHASKMEFNYFFLLSGDDIPIATNQYMNEFLTDNQGLEFVHFQNYKNKIVSAEDRLKYKYYNFHYLRNGRFLTRVLIKGHFIFRRLFLNQLYIENSSRFPTVYKGVNWFGISNSMLLYILDFLDKNPWYESCFKTSLCADEVFFHTIINTKKDAVFYFNSDALNNALRYIDWSSGPDYPRTLNEEDLSVVKEMKGIFFARKVKSDLSSVFLHSIIKHE